MGFIYTGWGIAELPSGTLGFVFLPALVVLATASSITAPLGVKVSHRLPMVTLKRDFSCVLYALAAYMMWKGLTS